MHSSTSIETSAAVKVLAECLAPDVDGGIPDRAVAQFLAEYDKASLGLEFPEREVLKEAVRVCSRNARTRAFSSPGRKRLATSEHSIEAVELLEAKTGSAGLSPAAQRDVLFIGDEPTDCFFGLPDSKLANDSTVTSVHAPGVCSVVPIEDSEHSLFITVKMSNGAIAASHVVLDNNKPWPQRIVTTVGSTIEFEYKASMLHSKDHIEVTRTSSEESVVESAPLSAGSKFSWMCQEAGDFAYRSAVFPYLKGSITVQPKANGDHTQALKTPAVAPGSQVSGNNRQQPPATTAGTDATAQRNLQRFDSAQQLGTTVPLAAVRTSIPRSHTSDSDACSDESSLADSARTARSASTARSSSASSEVGHRENSAPVNANGFTTFDDVPDSFLDAESDLATRQCSGTVETLMSSLVCVRDGCGRRLYKIPVPTASNGERYFEEALRLHHCKRLDIKFFSDINMGRCIKLHMSCKSQLSKRDFVGAFCGNGPCSLPLLVDLDQLAKWWDTLDASAVASILNVGGAAPSSSSSAAACSELQRVVKEFSELDARAYARLANTQYFKAGVLLLSFVVGLRDCSIEPPSSHQLLEVMRMCSEGTFFATELNGRLDWSKVKEQGKAWHCPAALEVVVEQRILEAFKNSHLQNCDLAWSHESAARPALVVPTAKPKRGKQAKKKPPVKTSAAVAAADNGHQTMADEDGMLRAVPYEGATSTILRTNSADAVKAQINNAVLAAAMANHNSTIASSAMVEQSSASTAAAMAAVPVPPRTTMVHAVAATQQHTDEAVQRNHRGVQQPQNVQRGSPVPTVATSAKPAQTSQSSVQQDSQNMVPDGRNVVPDGRGTACASSAAATEPAKPTRTRRPQSSPAAAIMRAAAPHAAAAAAMLPSPSVSNGYNPTPVAKQSPGVGAYLPAYGTPSRPPSGPCRSWGCSPANAMQPPHQPLAVANMAPWAPAVGDLAIQGAMQLLGQPAPVVPAVESVLQHATLAPMAGTVAPAGAAQPPAQRKLEPHPPPGAPPVVTQVAAGRAAVPKSPLPPTSTAAASPLHAMSPAMLLPHGTVASPMMAYHSGPQVMQLLANGMVYGVPTGVPGWGSPSMASLQVVQQPLAVAPQHLPQSATVAGQSPAVMPQGLSPQVLAAVMQPPSSPAPGGMLRAEQSAAQARHSAVHAAMVVGNPQHSTSRSNSLTVDSQLLLDRTASAASTHSASAVVQSSKQERGTPRGSGASKRGSPRARYTQQHSRHNTPTANHTIQPMPGKPSPHVSAAMGMPPQPPPSSQPAAAAAVAAIVVQRQPPHKRTDSEDSTTVQSPSIQELSSMSGTGHFHPRAAKQTQPRPHSKQNGTSRRTSPDSCDSDSTGSPHVMNGVVSSPAPQRTAPSSPFIGANSPLMHGSPVAIALHAAHAHSPHSPVLVHMLSPAQAHAASTAAAPVWIAQPHAALQMPVMQPPPAAAVAAATQPPFAGNTGRKPDGPHHPHRLSRFNNHRQQPPPPPPNHLGQPPVATTVPQPAAAEPCQKAAKPAQTVPVEAAHAAVPCSTADTTSAAPPCTVTAANGVQPPQPLQPPVAAVALEHVAAAPQEPPVVQQNGDSFMQSLMKLLHGQRPAAAAHSGCPPAACGGFVQSTCVSELEARWDAMASNCPVYGAT